MVLSFPTSSLPPRVASRIIVPIPALLPALISDGLSAIRMLDADSKSKSSFTRSSMPGLGFRSGEIALVLANAVGWAIWTIVDMRDFTFLSREFLDHPVRQLEELLFSVVTSRDSGLICNLQAIPIACAARYNSRIPSWKWKASRPCTYAVATFITPSRSRKSALPWALRSSSVSPRGSGVSACQAALDYNSLLDCVAECVSHKDVALLNAWRLV